MGVPVLDKDSGAIIFKPTPEELKIQALEEKVEHLEKEVENLKKLVRKRRRRW